MCDKMPQGKKTVSDEELLSAFSEVPGGFGSSKEIGEVVGMTRQGAHGRLSDLYEEGRVDKKKSSQRQAVWWPTEPQYHAFPVNTVDQQA